MRCCALHIKFCQDIVNRTKIFHDEEGNVLSYPDNDIDMITVKQCADSIVETRPEARRLGREKQSNWKAIPGNLKQVNQQRKKRNEEDTNWKEIVENRTAFCDVVERRVEIQGYKEEDYLELASHIKQHLIILLNDCLAINPTILENFTDSSVARHSDPKVMMAKCPEWQGFATLLQAMTLWN